MKILTALNLPFDPDAKYKLLFAQVLNGSDRFVVGYTNHETAFEEAGARASDMWLTLNKELARAHQVADLEYVGGGFKARGENKATAPTTPRTTNASRGGAHRTKRCSKAPGWQIGGDFEC